MTLQFPSPKSFLSLPWSDIAPLYEALESYDLVAENAADWLAQWSRLRELVQERGATLRIESVKDTNDSEAEAGLREFLGQVYPEAVKADQALIAKLLASKLEPAGMARTLKTLRVRSEIFRPENVELGAQAQTLNIEFNKIIAAQTIQWDGQEQTLTALGSIYQKADRATRKQIWQIIEARESQDRQAINDLWSTQMDNRVAQARNAGFGDDYRALRWLELMRLDYTPADCRSFHDAIEQAVVPAASRIYEKHRLRLGADRLRPWDLDIYQGTFPVSASDLKPYDSSEELKQRTSAAFHKVDPELGGYFDVLRQEQSMDLDNRKGKGPGAFCASLEASHRPFIFMNGVGQATDVNTMLHEAGHAFHNFETYALPYAHQRWSNMEFAEVASMAMELLAAPYLTEAGFYSEGDYARHRVRHLEKIILFWPYMAIVDAFQHWAYENPQLAIQSENCDATWAELWDRFIPAIDFSGLNSAKSRGWHRKRHIHRSPFYYVEYGLAQLGAVQVWEQALADQAAAVANYRKALALGGTASVPELYAAAGARFAFDRETVGQAIDLLESQISHYESL
jgi:oligoendopeptidase F